MSLKALLSLELQRSLFHFVFAVWTPKHEWDPLVERGMLNEDKHWPEFLELRETAVSMHEIFTKYRDVLRITYVKHYMQNLILGGMNNKTHLCKAIDAKVGRQVQRGIMRSSQAIIQNQTLSRSSVRIILERMAHQLSSFSGKVALWSRSVLQNLCFAMPDFRNTQESSNVVIQGQRELRNSANDVMSQFAVLVHRSIGFLAGWGLPAPDLRVLQVPCCTCQEALQSLLLFGLASDSQEQHAKRLAAWRAISGQSAMPAGSILMVEIGVLFGMTPDFLLPRIPHLFYVGLDPYVEYQEGYGNSTKVALQPFAQEMVDRFQTRASLIAQSSHNISFAALIPNGSLDLLFIDGDHDRDALENDLTIWGPKVRCGGIIAGDDLHLMEIPKVVWEHFAGKPVFVSGKTFAVAQCTCFVDGPPVELVQPFAHGLCRKTLQNLHGQPLRLPIPPRP